MAGFVGQGVRLSSLILQSQHLEGSFCGRPPEGIQVRQEVLSGPLAGEQQLHDLGMQCFDGQHQSCAFAGLVLGDVLPQDQLVFLRDDAHIQRRVSQEHLQAVQAPHLSTPQEGRVAVASWVDVVDVGPRCQEGRAGWRNVQLHSNEKWTPPVVSSH